MAHFFTLAIIRSPWEKKLYYQAVLTIIWFKQIDFELNLWTIIVLIFHFRFACRCCSGMEPLQIINSFRTEQPELTEIKNRSNGMNDPDLTQKRQIISQSINCFSMSMKFAELWTFHDKSIFSFTFAQCI